MRFFRYCDKTRGGCGKKFSPKTKYEKLCSDCRKLKVSVNLIKLICHNKNINIHKVKTFL